MSSNINPYNIDGTFPVAGQDNSSQGFRDNFTNTRNNFQFAQNEITELQNRSILKQALTGQSLNNDMAGTQIIRPQLSAWTQTLLDQGNISSSVTLDFNQANFQKITTASSISIDLINWPTSTGVGALGYGVMRVWIHVTDPSHTVTIGPDLVAASAESLTNYNADSQTLSFDTDGDYLFDFSSTDGGVTYLIMDLTRNRAVFTDPMFYYNNMVNSTVLLGYGEGVETAKVLEAGQDMVSALGSYNSVGIGSLSTANVAYTQMTDGSINIGGYTVTGARGNVQTANIQAVKSKDFLGYVNALMYTGTNNSGNTFQQAASISFFATGSNVAYGLGGNIAFFTADDGGKGVSQIAQVLGLENNLDANFYGNVSAVGNVTVSQNANIVGTATIGGITSIGGNTTINGGLSTNGGSIKRGTYVYTLATTGAATIVANTAVDTIIIDSTNSASIATANITLPVNPADRQVIKIATAANIVNANVYGGAGISVKWVPTNTFSSGNTAISLTFISPSTWYRS